MSKIFTNILFMLALCCFNLNAAFAQCDPAISAGSVSAPAITTALPDNSNMAELAVSPPPESVTMMPDYRFFHHDYRIQYR